MAHDAETGQRITTIGEPPAPEVPASAGAATPGAPTTGDGDAPGTRTERIAITASVVLPLPLLVYLGLNSGGFSAGITGVATTLLALLLVLRALVAPRTFRRPHPLALVACGALLAMACWQLLSSSWSHSAWRAVAEFDRTVLYLLAVTTFVTLPRVSMRTLQASVTVAIAVLGIVGLASRLRPDLFPVTMTVSPQRLSHPLGYWNAMGILMATGLVLCLHAAADSAGRLVTRLLGAAIFPILAVTLYFTVSRGGIAAAVIGCVAYVVLARPRGLLFALAAVVVPTYVAVSQAYDATALVGETPLSSLAILQGRHVATTLLWCLVAAVVIRLLSSPLDRRVLAIRVPRLGRRRAGLLWGAAAAILVVGVVAVDVPAKLHHQYERFVSDSPTNSVADPRARLREVYNGGRLEHWHVALEAARGRRLDGVGAGTFDLEWNRLRASTGRVTQAHSLYVETLAELGVVGLVLLLVALCALLASAIVGGLPAPQRAAAIAVMLAWAAHAGLDWDWEVPAVTLVALLLCAAAAATRPGRISRRWASGLAVGAVVLAMLPAVESVVESRLTGALAAYDRGDCAGAVRSADSARSLLPVRPEPYAISALCAARARQHGEAERFATDAIAQDPRDWEWRYIAALVTGSAGGDPRSHLAAAAARDPLGVPARALLLRLRESRRRAWPAETRAAFSWFHGHAHPGVTAGPG
jgi:hypothetical protein